MDTIAKALELSADDRAELARHLLLSLEAEDCDEDAEQAWAEEIDERLERADRSKAADWETVLQRIRGSLRRNRDK
ncbi:MAG TPA: addiction module protein [Tepidisphaeraceae bacterium]|nr:addiction module protein [Tepidisphaeraceae bacterium]